MFALADMLDLLADELACSRRWRLAFAQIFLRSFNCSRHNIPFLMNDAGEEFPSEPVELCGVTCIPPRYKMQLEPLACEPCHLLQSARLFEKVRGSGDNLQTLLAAKLL